MAGSLFHLWLARRAFPALAKGNRKEDALLLTAFQAGSVAPDIGFFPGGPRRLSHRIHHERTGDFARHLLALSRTPAEEAFAAGWALHLYTDIRIHPLINEEVALAAAGSGALSGRSDLWHKSLEWGLDCHVLEKSSAAEWVVKIDMPVRPGEECQLTGAAREYFPSEADDEVICRGWRSLASWVGRMPSIFKWAGSAKPVGHSPAAGLAGRISAPFYRAMSGLLAPVEFFENAVGLVNPKRPREEATNRMMARGRAALSDLADAWPKRFAGLANLDLDTGRPIDGAA